MLHVEDQLRIIVFFRYEWWFWTVNWAYMVVYFILRKIQFSIFVAWWELVHYSKSQGDIANMRRISLEESIIMLRGGNFCIFYENDFWSDCRLCADSITYNSIAYIIVFFLRGYVGNCWSCWSISSRLRGRNASMCTSLQVMDAGVPLISSTSSNNHWSKFCLPHTDSDKIC